MDCISSAITPASPAIDPAGHTLVINGLVRQPLAFSYENLLKYQMVSRIHFLECSGNSGSLLRGGNADGTAQSLHGLVSCAEWTGVPLSTPARRGWRAARCPLGRRGGRRRREHGPLGAD